MGKYHHRPAASAASSSSIQHQAFVSGCEHGRHPMQTCKEKSGALLFLQKGSLWWKCDTGVRFKLRSPASPRGTWLGFQSPLVVLIFSFVSASVA
ncbi:hypothetical protein BN2475_420012 [Paraburkholderia ribeironis]|uniref:Uncharacterized protein n=1 Tax=Paraburkholderia ribeironis TaxID=1247936 RepID=A0A1N7S778_9BURK|nr:hypothetical protein BN2475_420012 [Paraburkholderia ribeironis]